LLQRITAKGISRVLLFSADLALPGEEIVCFYRHAVSDSFLFRDGKGCMGLNHCQSRNTRAIDFHWNTSLCALNLAKWQEAQHCQQKRFFSRVLRAKKTATSHYWRYFLRG